MIMWCGLMCLEVGCAFKLEHNARKVVAREQSSTC
jgi:hypothetical protein